MLSGATGAIITGSITCANGSGATGSNSGGGGSSTNATIVAPTDAGGNVKVVQPAPSATQPINGTVTVIGPTTAAGNVAVSQQAAPAATTPVSCAAAGNCPVNASQVTSPWVDSTPSAGPAPTASTGAAPPAAAPYIFDSPSCAFNSGALNVTTGQSVLMQCTALGLLRVNVGNVVTTTQPTATPGGWAGVQPILYGTNATYVAPIGDTFAKSGSIVTAVTTLLISGVANQSIYIWLAAFQSTGTNASNTVSFEYGQGATCQTNTVVMNPSPTAPATTAGGWVSGWSGMTGATAVVIDMLPPAAVPLVLPNNATAYNFCAVTAGTTTSGVFVTLSAVH